MKINTSRNTATTSKWLWPIVAGAALLFAGAAQVNGADPVPFSCTGDAYTVRGDPQQGHLFLIDQTAMPFDLTSIGNGLLTGPFGTDNALIPIQVNNLGYNVSDNLLYAVAMPTSGNFNYGIIQIDSNGDVFPFELPDTEPFPYDVRLLAGDVSSDGSTMYINTHPTKTLFIIDLVTREVDTKVLADRVFVADWAVSPEDGMLYGAAGTYSGAYAPIYQLNPATGVITNFGQVSDLPVNGSGAEAYYGGAWFDFDGNLFVYRNNDWIYEIDLAGPTLVDDCEGDGVDSSLNDAASCTLGYGVIEKFYTHTWNDWGLRCAEYETDPDTGLPTDICAVYRPSDTDLDDDIFADPLDQIDNEFVLYGEVKKSKTTVNPGQYIAVSNIDVSVEHDVWILEDFEECTDIGSVSPNKVPGGVQVVLIDADGVVWDIDDDLALGIGGSIELEADYALVHVEAVPAGSTLRVMVKFKPHDTVGIGNSCTNHEILYDADPFGISAGIELSKASAVLTIVDKE